MSVKRPHGRALANEHGHIFQTFSHQSEGLATRDYHLSNPPLLGLSSPGTICRRKGTTPSFTECLTVVFIGYMFIPY